MPIAKVEAPDGTIHKLEVPEGATPQEIEAFAAENIPAPKQEPLSQSQAWTASQLKGIPFGADIAGAAAALTYGRDSELPFGEKQRMAKQLFQQAGNQASDEYPVMSTAGTLTSGLAVGLATPTSWLQAPSTAARAAKGAAVAGGLGALYGAGEGNTDEERASNAITQGIYAAPLGAAGNIASDIIGAGVRGGVSLAQRATKLFNKGFGRQPNITISAPAGKSITTEIQGALAGKMPAPMSMGQIPLTKGQATQSPQMQSLEYGAQAGIYGDDAQRMALEAAQLQSGAAKDVLGKVAGTDLNPDVALQSAEALKTSLQQSYKAAKARTTAAYNEVGEMSQDAPLQIAAGYVRDGIVPAIKDWARKGSAGRPWDLGAADMAGAKRLYQQAAAFADMKKISAVNFFRMEDWRGRVSQGIANSKTPAEKAFLSGMLQRYDTAMSQLPREAIKSGDEAILGAMEKARGARKAQGVLFERSKIVKDVLQNDDLTNEQFYNSLTSLGARSGSYVRDILRTAANEPAKQAALRGQIKQSILGTILNKSLSAEVKAGSTVEGGIEKMVSFDKLATNLDKFIKNKTLFNQVITDPAERKAIEEAYRAASLIKSVKPGSKNYSNTAYTLLNIINSISPAAKATNVAGVGLGYVMKPIAEAGAVKELGDSLAPVLKNIADENSNMITNFGQKYGRKIMSGASVQQSLGNLSPQKEQP